MINIDIYGLSQPWLFRLEYSVLSLLRETENTFIKTIDDLEIYLLFHPVHVMSFHKIILFMGLGLPY